MRDNEKNGRKERKGRDEGIGKNIPECSMHGKKRKKLKTLEHQRRVITRCLKVSTPSFQLQISSKNNENIVLMAWLKTNPIKYQFCKEILGLKTILSKFLIPMAS